METSETSDGSIQTLRCPHFMMEAARRFWRLRETMVLKELKVEEEKGGEELEMRDRKGGEMGVASRAVV